MSDRSGMPGSGVLKVLSVMVCLGGLGVAVFAFVMSGRHPAAVLPGLVITAAAGAMAWTPMGETKVGRVGLGVIVLGGAVALMALLFLGGGHNPSSIVFGALFVFAAAALTFGAPVSDAGADLLAWLAVAAIAVVLLITAVLIVLSGPRWLVVGGVALMAPVALLVGRTTTGPTRFALGVVVAMVTAAHTYFLAIGAQPVMAVLGLLVLASLWPSLSGGRTAHSADPAAGDQAVR